MQGIKGKKKSYVLNTVLAVDRALDNAKTKEEFIENMAKYNFKVNWSEQRKYITFEDDKGNKVRNINLQKTFNDDKFSKLRNNIEHKSKETIKDVLSIKERLRAIRYNQNNKKVKSRSKVKQSER